MDPSEPTTITEDWLSLVAPNRSVVCADLSAHPGPAHLLRSIRLYLQGTEEAWTQQLRAAADAWHRDNNIGLIYTSTSRASGPRP